MPINLTSVPISKPEEINLILGQAHFIKTLEDLMKPWSPLFRGSNSGWPSAKHPGPVWSGGVGPTAN